MAVSTHLVDTSFLLALLDVRDRHHSWSETQARQLPPPWQTCEAVLSEAFFLLPRRGVPNLTELLRRGALLSAFDFAVEQEPVLALMQKYANVPMSFADACLVRMAELHAEPIVLTTDADFRVYRRHSRQIVPSVMPT